MGSVSVAYHMEYKVMEVLSYLTMILSSTQQKGLSERKYANALIVSNRVIKDCNIRE